MKDFLKVTLVTGSMLALVLGVPVAAFTHWQSETAVAADPAPIAAADRVCGPMAVKMPCFRHADPERRAMAPVPLKSASADAERIAARHSRCAALQVKFPCLQRSDWRS